MSGVNKQKHKKVREAADPVDPEPAGARGL